MWIHVLGMGLIGASALGSAIGFPSVRVPRETVLRIYSPGDPAASADPPAR